MAPHSIAHQLETSGYCIYPGFLSPEELRETRGDLDIILDGGGFHRAGTGQGNALQVQDLVRRDEIFWMDRAKSNDVQTGLWTKLDLLKRAFNAPPLYLGLELFEGHYACYPPGGYYKRHLDSLKSKNDRVISLIIYLNLNWNPEDGGRLRIFQTAKPDSSFSDVDPMGGTMVCFMSDDFEHEVQTSNANRFSFSGWFK
jgi:SM-20-related protein